MTYKAHIDGLRSIAVLAVVIFHLGATFMPGGYVGVDVFFVISGFLITGILHQEMEAGEYSLLEFYKRRVLRIVPALVALFTGVLVAGAWLLFPVEQVDLGKTVAAAAGFISNIYFMLTADYFSAPAETQPMLHTWSLAVEEQFYIFFPPLLYLVMRYARKRVLAVLLGIVVVSLVASVAITQIKQPFAFYLIVTRAWELGVGALLAIAMRKGVFRWNNNPALAWLGMAMIAAAIFLFDKQTPFPGWAALIPVLGSALLIGCAEGNSVGKILSSGPAVWIGKISYSFYLWHWPVIVFWKIEYGGEPAPLAAAVLFAISMALGAISTFWVEKPFRSKAMRALPAGRVVLAGLGALSVFVVLGLAMSAKPVSLRSYPAQTVALADYADYTAKPDYLAQYRRGTCFIGNDDGGFASYDRAACITPDADKRNVLLLGDSHAAQYWGALDALLPDANVMQATASGCHPILGDKGASRCTRMREWVLSDVLDRGGFDAVVIAARWRPGDAARIGPTLRRLRDKGVNVVLVGPMVEYNGTFPLLLARDAKAGADLSHHLTQGRKAVGTQMAGAAEQASATYIDMIETICPGGACRTLSSSGEPMHFDYGHLTLSGSRDVVGENLSAIRRGVGLK
ncbi:acyltransferase family protein [Qipengyuania zhejiangensis]|uniref:acyltransferase family protein n=1 Tax=Qipengyuania zhejiangensis TaxID=3077782 RepID=UPI002D766A54|nr:acyltransferase family protein [Qipengyuania sp. Z2]